MTKGKSLHAIPFKSVQLVTFTAFGTKQEKFFKDATEEQILKFLTTKICETACILDIEDCIVVDVKRKIPKKRKLHEHELKMGITEEQRVERVEKIKVLKEQIKK